MSVGHIALLPDRGVVAVTGADARDFLDNLVTNDMALLDRQSALHAGLLTPQGKILFAFFVVRRDDGFLLETTRQAVPDLVKRLGLYRLRAKVTINDLSASHAVLVAWGGDGPDYPLATRFADPRHPGLGERWLMAPEMAGKLEPELESPAGWHAHRISLGVPEAGLDYALGDTFPHEADFDLFHGVSFSKGCFVGQEVVARMQHKSVVRKRIVRIEGAAPLTPGSTVEVGEVTIGSVGSVAGMAALALVRLDRVVEARQKEQPQAQALTAGGVAIEIDASALTQFTDAAARRTT